MIAAIAGPEECGKNKNPGATMRKQAYLDMMALFKASDIANLDGEMVDCGHVLMPFTNVKTAGQ